MKFTNLLSALAVACGVLLLAGSSHAQTTSFSDTPLTPNSSPSAAVGNDLLLAEYVSGPRAATPYVAAAPADSWTTQLVMQLASDTTRGQIDYSKSPVQLNVTAFGGSGPTGYYAAGTIGSGKHTEDTNADAKVYIKPGISYGYVYIVSFIGHDRLGNPYPPVKYQASVSFYTVH
jgi:hypothetical protein